MDQRPPETSRSSISVADASLMPRTMSPHPGPTDASCQTDPASSGLERLPYDIKYLILESIPDYETLIKFSQSSRVFYRIFRGHRLGLLQRLMFNEASVYMEESYLLACLADKMTNGTMSVAELDSMYKCYKESLLRPTFEQPWYYAEVLRGGAKMRAKIAESHRGIKAHCENFIRRELNPKINLRPPKEDETDYHELPPTDSERHRVMQALYKIWLLLKVHNVRVSDPKEFAPFSHNVGTLSYPLRADVARYLKLWDYWDLKVVQVLLPIFWNDMKAKYDKKGENIIRDALSRYEEDYSRSFTIFLNTTLHLYFPNTGLRWMGASSSETEMWQHVRNVVEYLSDEEMGDHFEQLGDFTGIAYIYFQQVYGSAQDQNGFPGPEVFDNIPLKRLCRPGRFMEGYPDEGIEGKRRFLKSLNHASLAKADLQSCMWDDWRLESWGYLVPSFTPSTTQRSESPTASIQDSLAVVSL
ncbi:hypothetical protein TWF281_004809 [Arthrobotrys megalospora]